MDYHFNKIRRIKEKQSLITRKMRKVITKSPDYIKEHEEKSKAGSGGEKLAASDAAIRGREKIGPVVQRKNSEPNAQKCFVDQGWRLTSESMSSKNDHAGERYLETTVVEAGENDSPIYTMKFSAARNDPGRRSSRPFELKFKDYRTIIQPRR